MDNEFDSDIKEAMEKYNFDVQLAPLYMHRLNAA